MRAVHYKVLFLFLLLCSVEIVGKRGGGGFGRGSSSARASSAGRGGGGLFSSGGTGRSSSGSSGGSGGWSAPKPSYGRTGWGGGGGGHSTFGGREEERRRMPSFSSGNGIGSHSRANTFKNMIIGAAAGVIAYEAGKAIIRSVAAPVRWGGRDYYWGSEHYPGGGMSAGRPMCRMPVDASDPQFGNIFLPGGQSRPKEIVWSCNHNEQCCGYECCPGGGYGGGYWNSRPGVGTGTIILLVLLCAVAACFLKHLYDKKRERDAEAEERAKYQQGTVNFSAPTATDGGPPPPYGFNVSST